MLLQTVISIYFEILLIIFTVIKYKSAQNTQLKGCFINQPLLHVLITTAMLFLTICTADDNVNNSFVITMVIFAELVFVMISCNFSWKEITKTRLWFIIVMIVLFQVTHVCLSVIIGLDNFFNGQYLCIASSLFLVCSTSAVFPTKSGYTDGSINRHLKSMFFTFSIVVSLNILWLPLFIRNISMLLDSTNATWNRSFRNITIMIAFSNSIFDVLLYLRSIRRGLKSTIA